MILMAQSVPTATAVPCIASFPAGWDSSDVLVKSDRARFRLETGGHQVTVTLRPPDACSTEGAIEVASDEVGMRRFEDPRQLPPQIRATTDVRLAWLVRDLRLRLRGRG